MKKPKNDQRKIEEVDLLKLKFFRYLFGRCEQKGLGNIGPNILYTGTGRAALRIILEHLTIKGILANKNSEILIPQWLCQSVAYTLSRFCHPTISVTNNIKALMVYHQYGFPQNMDEICGFCEENNITLIEDCANVYESYYKTKRLGTFGEASIFSFSKLFPSVLGGALVTRNKELYEYGKSRLKDTKYSHVVYWSRLLWEILKDTPFRQMVSDIQEMVYAKTDGAFRIKDISLRAVGYQLKRNIWQRRKRNYLFVLEYFSDRPEYFQGLEREGVTPYVAPLFDREDNLEKMKKKLLENNILTGIYHFDVNRNILDPVFRKCLWIPVHQGLELEDVERICAVVKKAV